MKKIALILTALTFAVFTLSAQEKAEKKNDKISEVKLSCEMKCGNCAAEVKKQLAYTKGVKYVETDFEKDIIVVKYRNDRTDADKLIASLGEINYKATVNKPGCSNAQKACCSGKTKSSGCAGSSPADGKHEGCSGKSATTVETKSGCCSGKTVEPSKK